MIVLDEQLKDARIKDAIGRWYRGRVVNITSLRPGTVIKDDAIPMLLRQLTGATFVTINTTDFWGRISGGSNYCVVCLSLSDDRADEIPELLRRLFRLAGFETKRSRSGKVALVSRSQVQFYQVANPNVQLLHWPTL